MIFLMIKNEVRQNFLTLCGFPNSYDELSMSLPAVRTKCCSDLLNYAGVDLACLLGLELDLSFHLALPFDLYAVELDLSAS